MRGDALRLLAGLTNGAARGFIELRLIEPHTRAVRQEFFPLAELEGAVEAAIAAREDTDAYFGVAPRVREAGGRDAVNAVPAVWVDVDTPAAREVLDAFAAPPSLVVASGTEGNVHAYWLLETPTDVATAERLNRLLAQAIGADPAAVDASRILRLPGTLNHKTSPPT